jgi:hypothetical protein
MKNLWAKKNPFLSMWLSGANAMLGAARGQAAAHARRHLQSINRATARQIAEFWSGSTAKPHKRPRRTR